jgi:nucleotide-binding universal stress UspA family protein
MKKIVVATDFSAPAEKAMFYAGQIASTIDASVLLLHVYQIPVGMNDMPLLVVSTEELKKNADDGLSRAKNLLQRNYGALNIETESRLGDVIAELRDVCEKTNPFFIAAGKHGASGVERFLFGSTSLSIIRHATYPVIVVPDHSNHFQIKTAALAIDESIEKLEIRKIKSIVQELKIQLHIIHVKQEKGASLEVKDLLTELNSNCETIYDHEFVHGIESYVRENNIDLLIIHPHRHNLVEQLFFKTHTKELLKKISIPLMCINDNVNFNRET